MKAKISSSELRIGNYANYKGIAIELAAEDFAQLESDIELGIIVPIKLTEQWVKGFGFKKVKENETYWYSLEINRHTELITNDIGKDAYSEKLEFVFISEFELDIEFKYVHQLQNLYFCLSGKELTK